MAIDLAGSITLNRWPERRMPGLRPWALRGLLGLLVTAFGFAGLHLAQWLVVHELEAEAIETKALGSETPAQFGAAYETLRLPVGDGTVEARLVQPADPTAPAVLVFHGNGEAVSDWSRVQALLFRAGVGSMVFDYGGFGASVGTPSVERMRADAQAAYTAWLQRTPQARSHVLVGHSLGNAVMLDAVPLLRPAPSGVVVHAGFTSAREFAVRERLVSPLLAQLLPDLWDNAAALARPGPEVLVLHGEQDDVIPAEMGRRLAQAAGARARFQAFAGLGHDQFYLDPTAQEWNPVIAFAQLHAH